MNRTKIEEFIEELESTSNNYYTNVKASDAVIHKGDLDEIIQRHKSSLLAEDGGEVKVTEDKIAEYLAFRYEFDNHLMRCITHNLQTMKKDESDEWRVNDFFSHNLHKMFTQSDVASQHTKGKGV